MLCKRSLSNSGPILPAMMRYSSLSLSTPTWARRRGRVPLLQRPIDNPLHHVGEARQRPHPSHQSAAPRRQASKVFLPLTGAHAVGHAFVEVGRAHRSLYASQLKARSYFAAHAVKGEGDPLPLQLLYGVQHRVAASGIDEVDRIRIQKDLLCRWLNRRERCLQTLAEVADTREEQVAADAP